MSYAFDDRNPQRPTFRRTRGGQIAGLGCLVIIALFFLAAGCGALLLGDVAIEHVVIAFGLGGLFGSALILAVTRVSLPREIVFEPSAGALLVFEGRRALAAPDAVLPFAELSGVAVRRVVSQSSKSRSVNYQVEVRKGDGGVFELVRYRQQERAEAVKAKIEAVVDFDAPASTTPPRRGDSRLVVERLGTNPSVSWPSRLSFGRLFATLLMLASLAAAGVTGAWLYHWVAAVVAATLLAVITLLALRAQLRAFGASYVIEVQGEELVYGWRGGILGQSEERVPLSEVDTVTFSFSPSQGQFGMLVLTPEQAGSLRRTTEAEAQGAGDVMGLAFLLLGARKLDTKELSFGEQIELERALQEILRGRGAVAK